MTSIRIASIEDIPLIHQFGKKAFYPTYLPFISEAQVDYMFHKMYDAEALMQQMKERGDIFLLAYQSDVALGFASYQLNYDGQQTTKLHKLYVLPYTQTKGIGKALLQTAEEQSRNAGQQNLLLNVNRYNKAVDFYKHLGYTIHRIDDIDIGNGFFMNDYEMIKSL